MLLNNITDPKFDFNVITLIPDKLSDIRSRREIEDLYDEYCFLPLMSAPMNSVISIKTKDSFNKDFTIKLSNIMAVCNPRGYDGYQCNSDFQSISLSEFELIENDFEKFKILIKNSDMILCDIANGHISKLLVLSKIFIEKFPYKKLMLGNIANPETYEEYAKIGVHYARLGIGAGNVCTTTSNTSIHYPLASLISECYKIKIKNNYKTDIVADGGFKGYSDIIKALALGADWVMLGSVLNKCLESDSYPYLYKRIKITNMTVAKWLFKHKFPLFKRHVGMSTKEIQKIWGNKKLKTSEGIVRWNKVEYTFDGWIENFKDYLASTMSYMGCKNLQELPEKAKIIFITNNALNRFNK